MTNVLNEEKRYDYIVVGAGAASSRDTDINIALVPHQLTVVTPEVTSRFGTPPPDAFTIAPALVQPTSRGTVRLASNNFQDAAVIDGNYSAQTVILRPSCTQSKPHVSSGTDMPLTFARE